MSDAESGVTVDPQITAVAVVGSGVAGWSAAAALKRRISSLNVEVISSPPAADSIVDRVISTLPSIVDFHADIGLTDADTIVRAQSALRAGTIFEGWADGLADYVHAYGNYGVPIDGTPFHQQWLRARAVAKVQPFDRFSPAAELGRSGRFAAQGTAIVGAMPTIGYGLQLTMERYQQLMRAYALHLGVAERGGEIAAVPLRPSDGFIDRLELTDGTRVTAELYVDCTGPQANIRSKLGGEFIDWSGWLPCDRLIFATAQPRQDAQLLDGVSSTAFGWQWAASSPAASCHGVAYSSAHASRDEAIAALPSAAAEISIRQGRWAQPWLRNCVAVGDAAVTVEPLEWANLHLVHSQIDRLVSMMCGRDCAAVELGEYNRQSNAEADRIRDFVCAHYVTARRDEPFWAEASRIEPPESLAHTLLLFAERGRLPYYEEETFSRDSWLAVLLGQGFTPRRTDPLADIVPIEDVTRSIANYREAIKSFVDSQPVYHQVFSSLGQHA